MLSLRRSLSVIWVFTRMSALEASATISLLVQQASGAGGLPAGLLRHARASSCLHPIGNTEATAKEVIDG